MDIQAILVLGFQLLMGVSLAACAGFRAFVPLFVVGLAGRFELIPLSERFEWLASSPALLVLATAVIVEALADKVPVVDHTLDLFGTLVRPVAGAIAVASPLASLDPLLATVVGVVLGTTVAGGVHVAKSQARLASSVCTSGTANPLVSFVEDIVSWGGSILSIALPLIAFLVIATAVFFVVRSYRRRKNQTRVVLADLAS